MADQIPTNTTPAAMVTLDADNCPDQHRILDGHHERGETVTCQLCASEHTITEAVPVHFEADLQVATVEIEAAGDEIGD